MRYINGAGEFPSELYSSSALAILLPGVAPRSLETPGRETCCPHSRFQLDGRFAKWAHSEIIDDEFVDVPLVLYLMDPVRISWNRKGESGSTHFFASKSITTAANDSGVRPSSSFEPASTSVKPCSCAVAQRGRIADFHEIRVGQSAMSLQRQNRYGRLWLILASSTVDW